MKKDDAIVFIDANQYLDFYRLPIKKSKKVLDLLWEQQGYIFVTMQVVDEVQRNKLRVAERFLTEQLKQLEEWSGVTGLTDYLFNMLGEPAATLGKKLRNVSQETKEVRTDLMNAVVQTLQLISLSDDKISKALKQLFSKALDHTPEEIELARKRKERGNPPGKQADPLGDQLTWEQLLSHFQGNSRLWIISRDSDYFTKHPGGGVLNPLLYKDLVRLNQKSPEVFCFDRIGEGINDFVQRTRVKTKKLLTPEESQEIKKAQDALPPLDWLPSSLNDANYVAVLSAKMRQSASAAITALTANQVWNSKPESDPDKP